MSKTDNMYGFVDMRWNPLAGKCYHNCTYCSTNKLKKRFPVIKKKYSGYPRIIKHELKNLGKNKLIFVASQNDLFANNVPKILIEKITNHCRKYDNVYFFQTKNTYNIDQKLLPPKSIVCTTLETNRFYPQMNNSPHPNERGGGMLWIDPPKQITIEPIMDFDLNDFVEMIRIVNPYVVNIGADSKDNNLPEPSREKTIQLINELSKFTKVKTKTNLKRIL